MPTVEENRTSTRQQESGHRRVLDGATRDRRLRKRLEALEADNHQKEFVEKDEPVVKKKQRLFVTEDLPENTRKSSEEEKKSAPKKKRKSTVLQRRKLKTFNNLLDDEKHRLATDPDDHQVSYFTVAAPPSLYPPRRFCEVCGNFSKYVCIVCGAFYCQVKCLNTHKETRCLKWTA